MIIHLKSGTSEAEAKVLAEQNKAVLFKDECFVLVTSSKVKEANAALQLAADKIVVTESDIQLAGTKYRAEKRTIQVGDWSIGGQSQHTVLISGP